MSNEPFFSVLLDWRGAGLPACSKNQEMLLGPSFNDSLNGHFSSKREPNEAFTTLSVLHSEEAMTTNKEDGYMWFVRWEIREVKMKWQILPFSFKEMFLT